MKSMLTLLVLFLTARVFAQSATESEIMNVSKDFFRWEVEGKWDSLINLMDDKVVIFNSGGLTKTKNEYLDELKSGRPVHNVIEVLGASATVTENTAIVWGKVFEVYSLDGNKTSVHLGSMQVFMKKTQGWKLMAFHTARLPN